MGPIPPTRSLRTSSRCVIGFIRLRMSCLGTDYAVFVEIALLSFGTRKLLIYTRGDQSMLTQ